MLQNKLTGLKIQFISVKGQQKISSESKPVREVLQGILNPSYWPSAHNQNWLQNTHAPYV